ncbi:MAG: LysR family transcriptional regulator substrate-binding protein, partial [Blautia sp.]|nr:LysR family transcriptional regulator substrate-binding protein [Blautia sp.]
IIDDYEQAIRNLDGKVTPRHVRVCGCELILVNGYSEMFSAFCQDYGTLHLSIKTIPNAQGPALISSNEADIGIFYSIHRTKLAKVMEQALYLEPVCLVASPSHPLFQREAVRFTDLDGELFAFPHDTCPCAITLLEHMGDNNAYPSKAYYLGFMSLVAEKAITEHAILAMPYSSVAHYQHHYGLHMLPLKEEPMLMWARMIYRDGELEELPKSILHYGAKHAQSCIRRLPHIYRPVTG